MTAGLLFMKDWVYCVGSRFDSLAYVRKHVACGFQEGNVRDK